MRLVALARQTVLEAGIENFTCFLERGLWNGMQETAVVFEVISSNSTMPLRIRHAAGMLKQMPEAPQEAVLVTIDPTESYII